MSVLPPGTILQLMYLRERLQRVVPGVFLEVGPGSGEITALLLSLGWRGSAYDLADETIDLLRSRFANEIAAGVLTVDVGDFCAMDVVPQSVDLVISSMVMEHLDDTTESRYIEQAATCLTERGLLLSLVPAHMQFWGIEDDIAGHFRRYSQPTVRSLLARHKWTLRHVAGLTFPLSNLLLPLSNRQVAQHEGVKVELTYIDRTKDSGHRNVPYKTHFPEFMKYVLNPVTLWPFHILQKACVQSENAMILYFEATPPRHNDIQRDTQ
jgi:SAM-dependent methyltransferase